MKKSISLMLLSAFLTLGAAAITPTQVEARHTGRHSAVRHPGKHKAAKNRHGKRTRNGRNTKNAHRVTREQSISVLREYLPQYADIHETKNPDPTHAYVQLPANFDFRSPFASTELRFDLIRNIDSWLGTRYRFAGSSKRGVDCSGFTSAVVSSTFNSGFHGNSRWQAHQLMPVFVTDSLQFGDLLFFTGRGRRTDRIGHVGIYLGNGVFAHSSTGRGVMYSRLEDGYYSTRFRWGGRFLSNSVAARSRSQYTHQ